MDNDPLISIYYDTTSYSARLSNSDKFESVKRGTAYGYKYISKNYFDYELKS